MGLFKVVPKKKNYQNNLGFLKKTNHSATNPNTPIFPRTPPGFIYEVQPPPASCPSLSLSLTLHLSRSPSWHLCLSLAESDSLSLYLSLALSLSLSFFLILILGRTFSSKSSWLLAGCMLSGRVPLDRQSPLPKPPWTICTSLKSPKPATLFPNRINPPPHF